MRRSRSPDINEEDFKPEPEKEVFGRMGFIEAKHHGSQVEESWTTLLVTVSPWPADLDPIHVFNTKLQDQPVEDLSLSPYVGTFYNLLFDYLIRCINIMLGHFLFFRVQTHRADWWLDTAIMNFMDEVVRFPYGGGDVVYASIGRVKTHLFSITKHIDRMRSVLCDYQRPGVMLVPARGIDVKFLYNVFRSMFSYFRCYLSDMKHTTLGVRVALRLIKIKLPGAYEQFVETDKPPINFRCIIDAEHVFDSFRFERVKLTLISTDREEPITQYNHMSPVVMPVSEVEASIPQDV